VQRSGLLFVLCSALLAWVGAASAELPPALLNRPVVDVIAVGDAASAVDTATLQALRGKPLSRGLVRTLIKTLARSARFSSVAVEAEDGPEGVVLQLLVTPRLVAHRIDIVGNHALDERAILRHVSLREGATIEVDAFDMWTRNIEVMYARRGFRDASARVVLRDMDDPTQKVVRVEVYEGAPTEIREIVFEGDALPRRRGLRGVLGFRPGDRADLDVIEPGLKRTELLLRRKGFYAAQLGDPKLEAVARGVRLVIPSQVGQAFEVRFHGAGPLGDSELLKAMAPEEERIAGEPSLRAAELRIVEAYRKYGFRDVTVAIQAHDEVERIEVPRGEEPIVETTTILDVEIVPGTQLEIDAITFPGAFHFDTTFLREQMFSYLEEALPGSSLRAPVDSELADDLGFGGQRERSRRDLPRPMTVDPRRLFYAAAYEQAVQHMRELYAADGFLAADVRDVVLSPLDLPGHAVAVVEVHEGPQTFLHDVEVEHNTQLASRELLHATKLERGSPFSYLKLEEARIAMLEACQERGFFFARVEADVRFSDDGSRAVATLRVDEGYEVRVGRIEIRGLDRARRSMVEDRLRLRVGDVFRPSKARETQDALLGLDIFTSVTVTPDAPELPARKKTILVSVSERKTQWLGFSTGFSTGEGLRGGVEYGYRNLFGSAIHAAFRGQLGYQFVFLDSEIERQYRTLRQEEPTLEYQTTLTFGVPYIPSLPKNTASVDFTVLSDIQRDFRIRKQAVVGSFVWRPIRRVTLSISEELEASNFRLLAAQLDNPNVSFSNLVPDGQNTLLATQLSFTLDLRDRAYNPRRGVLISLSPEYDRTLSSDASSATALDSSGARFRSNMLRLNGSFAFYLPLAPKLTFASQWRYGRILHVVKGSESYPNRLFYLGGSTFRGYQVNQVVPQDLRDDPNYASNTLVSHGGQVFLAGQNELRFPLVSDLYGGLFADVGNLWFDPGALDLRQLLVVYGAGLRFQTPVASLAFDYGIRQVRSGLDVVGAFQFAFQTF
jgi:outer membrane protein assembly factor BamA